MKKIVLGIESSCDETACALVDEETGHIAIYYGAADTYIALAFTTVDRVVDYLKKNGR